MAVTAYNQSRNNIYKTWMLMGIFFIIVIIVGWAASAYFGNPGIVLAATGFAFFGNFTAFFFSDKVALSSMAAKPADPKNPVHLRAIRATENMSIAAGIPRPPVYIINDAAPNAFATGRSPKHAAVAYTTGILELLDKNELEGVAAHEISHIKNRDTLVMTIVVVLVGFIAIIGELFLRGSLFGGGGRDNKAAGIILAVGLVFAILSPIVAKLIQLAISRKREFLADSSGVLLTRHPEGLASALEKISGVSKPVERASTATAHLFIANPFGDRDKKGPGLMEKLFSTHPPVDERTAALRNMDTN